MLAIPTRRLALSLALATSSIVGCASEEAEAHESANPQALAADSGDGAGNGPARRAKRGVRDHFAADDANHDGALSEDEVNGRFWNHIVVADANQDGKVTLAELETARQNGTLKPRFGGPRGKKSAADTK